MGEGKNAAASRLKASGFDIWDIFSEKSTSTVITFENNRIDKISSGIDAGTGVRGTKDFKTFYGFVNSEENLENAVKSFAQAPPSGSISFSRAEPSFTNEISIDPFSVEINQKTGLLKKMNDLARSQSTSISQVNLTYSEKNREIEIINDTGKIFKEKSVYTTFFVLVIAQNGGRIETGYRALSGYGGYEVMDEARVAEKVREAALSAARLLDIDRKITGEMTAIISSSAGGTLIHEAVGHSLEADLVQKQMSVYPGKKGQKAASPVVTVIDDGTLPGKRGSFSFDDEGVESRKTILIEKGVLKNYMYDRETALREGTASTGNGRRENYRFRPIPRMTNTMIAPGKGNPDELVKDTKSGIFVKKMGGGQVNTVTGEFIFEVKEGYMIEKGKITQPIRDATLMGKGPEVLNSIDAVCDDLGFEVGTCGKDGQGVPVSDAQPTLRVPRILVGSK